MEFISLITYLRDSYVYKRGIVLSVHLFLFTLYDCQYTLFLSCLLAVFPFSKIFYSVLHPAPTNRGRGLIYSYETSISIYRDTYGVLILDSTDLLVYMTHPRNNIKLS